MDVKRIHQAGGKQRAEYNSPIEGEEIRVRSLDSETGLAPVPPLGVVSVEREGMSVLLLFLVSFLASCAC